MVSAIFVNMPVADVARSREFFTALGFGVNEKFSGSDNVCVEVNSSISAMMLNPERFKGFIDKEVASKSTSEVILSLACESEAEVRLIAEKAFTMGARKVNEADDNEYMFSWAFEDLDGHVWDLFWMKS
jgi:uncharacterized protein